MNKVLLTLLLASVCLFAAGCAITDFSGWTAHNTQAEAKLWGQDIAFSGTGDATLDGTYTYTVKYDNRLGQGTVTINSYRNPVFAAFTRDGIVDQDGDDIQGSAGSLTGVPASPAGKFLPQFKAVDTTGGPPNCEFFSNITFDKSAGGAMIALCSTTNEEVDKDLDLNASFSSLDDLMGQIWSGALAGTFSMELTALRFNGESVSLNQPFSIWATAASLRPAQWVVDLSQPGGAGLIEAILANTEDGVGYRVGMEFAGGMSVTLPANVNLAFNHAGLATLIQ